MSETNGYHANDTKGVGDQMLARSNNLRSDCRTLAKMLSCGAIAEENIAKYLQKTGELLEEKLDAKNERAVRRLWQVLNTAARLDQIERHKFLDKTEPDKHELSGQIEIRKVLQQARDDPHYADLRRARIIGHSGEPGTNGHSSQSGQLANGSAPCNGRPGNNGHHSQEDTTANPDGP